MQFALQLWFSWIANVFGFKKSWGITGQSAEAGLFLMIHCLWYIFTHMLPSLMFTTLDWMDSLRTFSQNYYADHFIDVKHLSLQIYCFCSMNTDNKLINTIHVYSINIHSSIRIVETYKWQQNLMCSSCIRFTAFITGDASFKLQCIR